MEVANQEWDMYGNVDITLLRHLHHCFNVVNEITSRSSKPIHYDNLTKIGASINIGMYVNFNITFKSLTIM